MTYDPNCPTMTAVKENSKDYTKEFHTSYTIHTAEFFTGSSYWCPMTGCVLQIKSGDTFSDVD